MNEPINDGGPAFPIADANHSPWGGMSLRDWFAGMALSSHRPVWHEITRKEVVEACFLIADDMLEARKKDV